jgi:hypothetical protein
VAGESQSPKTAKAFLQRGESVGFVADSDFFRAIGAT